MKESETQICRMCKLGKPITKFDKMSTKAGKVRRKTCRKCTENGKGRYNQILELQEKGLKDCRKCDRILSTNDFYSDKYSSNGLMDYCKECWKKRNKEWSANHQDIERAYDKKYLEENIKDIKEYRKAYNQKPEVKQRNNEYRKNRRKNDPIYKMRYYLRTRLNKAIKRNLKAGSAVRDLGCTIEELKQHLEKQFKPGMCWESWNTFGWHIDHIIPLSSFDLTDREQFLKACHYTNLQPLWWEENLKKGNSLIS